MLREYDYSAPPSDTREFAECIGCSFTEKKGVGHFPMSESPEAFNTYLTPVLDQITAD